MTDMALYSLDENSVVTFSLSNIDRLISGPEEALQIVAYHLFQRQGTNTYDRDDGAGLLDVTRGSILSKDELMTEIVICISRALARIRETQSTDKDADATITGLRLLDLRVDTENAKIDVAIRVDLLDGNSFQATFRSQI